MSLPYHGRTLLRTMLRVLPAAALLLLPLAAVAAVPPAAPTPEATMPSAPSPDQMYRVMQAAEPLARADEARYRSAMIAAVLPEHRQAIGDAFAAYVMRPAPDRASLGSQIDGIITAAERERIAEAQNAHLADLKASSARVQAEMAREFPQFSQGQPSGEQQASLVQATLGTPGPPPSAGAVLAGWLVAPPPHVISAGYFAPNRAWTPLQAHGPGDAAIRSQLRASMLAAILPEHRGAVARAFAAYAFSPDGSYDTPAAEIDAVLSPQERSAVANAYAAFAAGQRAAAGAMEAQRQAFFAQLPPAERPEALVTFNVGADDAGTPGMLFVKSLLAPSMTISLQRIPNGTTIPAEPQGP